jgi:hypothetical protein
MKVRISIAEADRPVELKSLAFWLREEPELAGRVAVTENIPQAGELEAVADALVVVVGSGRALSILAASLSTWLQSRASGVRIRLQTETGQTVEIGADLGGIDALQAVAESLAGVSSEEHAVAAPRDVNIRTSSGGTEMYGCLDMICLVAPNWTTPGQAAVQARMCRDCRLLGGIC